LALAIETSKRLRFVSETFTPALRAAECGDGCPGVSLQAPCLAHFVGVGDLFTRNRGQS